MKGTGYWAIRTYESGSVGEKIKFWIPGEKPPKSKRKLEADIRKSLQNRKSSERSLARILNANFKPGDMLIGLDYSEENYKKLGGKKREEKYKSAEKEIQKLLRRVKREAAKDGVTVKAVCVTSDMDPKTKKDVRVHHHIVANKEAAKYFEKKWKSGSVDFEPLSSQPDYMPLAVYLIEQARGEKNKKKYISTRNLIRPKGKDRIAKSGSELSVPRGAVLLHRSEYSVGFTQYIRYILPPNREKATTG